MKKKLCKWLRGHKLLMLAYVVDPEYYMALLREECARKYGGSADGQPDP